MDAFEWDMLPLLYLIANSTTGMLLLAEFIEPKDDQETMSRVIQPYFASNWYSSTVPVGLIRKTDGLIGVLLF